MKLLLKLISLGMLWSAVGYIVMYVDPETLRDIGVAGLFLPFVAAVVIAIWYTTLIFAKSLVIAVIIAGLFGLTLILSITHLLSAFTAVIIVLLMIFSIYLFKTKNSPHKSTETQE